MTYKWNLEAAQRYSAHVANDLSDHFFENNSMITGPQLIQFTEIKPLNWLILKRLFFQWEEEIKRWKSPYFDYQQPDVIEAQKVFFNRASQHISIQKSDFRPLVHYAITELLALLIAPEEFFGLQGGSWALTPEWWEKNEKYLLVQSNLCQQLKAERYPLDETRWKNLIIGYAEPAHSEMFTDIWQKLEGWHPLPAELKSTPKIESKVPVVPSTGSFFDQLSAESHIPTVPAKPVAYVEKVPIVEVSPPSNQLLNLNDSQSTIPSVGDLHQKSKITSIMGSLSINQKFTFINRLFQGDAILFQDTVEDLENSTDFSMARDKLVKKYVPRFIWDVTAPEVEEFFDMVERRFK